jgi:hypothetical protein
MVDRIPVVTKTIGSGADGLAELQAGETIGIAHGGTGALNLSEAKTNLGIVDSIYSADGAIIGGRLVTNNSGTLVFRSDTGKVLRFESVGTVTRNRLNISGFELLMGSRPTGQAYDNSYIGVKANNVIMGFKHSSTEKSGFEINDAGVLFSIPAGKKFKINNTQPTEKKVLTGKVDGGAEWKELPSNFYTENGTIEESRTVTNDVGNLVFKSDTGKSISLLSYGSVGRASISVSANNGAVYFHRSDLGYTKSLLSTSDASISLYHQYGADSTTQRNRISCTSNSISLVTGTGSRLRLQGVAGTVGQVITNTVDGTALWQDIPEQISASQLQTLNDLSMVEWGSVRSISAKTASTSYVDMLTWTPTKTLDAGTYRVKASVVVSMNSVSYQTIVRLYHNNAWVGFTFSKESKDQAGSTSIYGVNVQSASYMTIEFEGDVVHTGGVFSPYMIQGREEQNTHPGFRVWDFYIKLEKIF